MLKQTSLYSLTKVSLSFNSYISTLFSASIGLKQGDILRTMFYSLFINDLPMLLEKRNTQFEESESLELFSTQIFSLLSVGNFAIFSCTKNGLQEKNYIFL